MKDANKILALQKAEQLLELVGAALHMEKEIELMLPIAASVASIQAVARAIEQRANEGLDKDLVNPYSRT